MHIAQVLKINGGLYPTTQSTGLVGVDSNLDVLGSNHYLDWFR